MINFNIKSAQYSYLILLILECVEAFWIGGTNLGNEPHFYWMGEKKSMIYTDWLEHQPDNWQGNENCIEIWTAMGSKWNDRVCTTLSNFVCEEFHANYDVDVRSNIIQ